MKIPQCNREHEVVEAVRSGRWAGPWGEEIRRHAGACAVCSEVALIAEALHQEHEFRQAEARLPGAGLVWWKAQLAARRAAEERAAQPIAWVERMAQFFAALVVVGLAWWQWPRILGWWGGPKRAASLAGSSAWAADWSRELLHTLTAVLNYPPSYLLVVCAGALLTLLAFAAYVVWREE